MMRTNVRRVALAGFVLTLLSTAASVDAAGSDAVASRIDANACGGMAATLQPRVAANDPAALADWALATYRGCDTGASPASAYRLYARAAAAGDRRAVVLGMGALAGTPSAASAARAIALLGQAAREGDPNASFFIGQMYDRGTGVRPDAVAALRWYRLGATAGDTRAMGEVGSFDDLGRGGLPVDHQAARAEYQRGADANDAWCLGSLAHQLAVGWGSPVDDALAVTDAQRSADGGYAGGETMLAWLEFQGLGTPKNPADAFRWATKAADQNNVQGLDLLGYFYNTGIGTPVDNKKVVEVERRAAAIGHDGGVAENALGAAYNNGQGVAANLSLALYWYRRAANDGNALARRNLTTLLASAHVQGGSDPEDVRIQQQAEAGIARNRQSEVEPVAMPTPVVNMEPDPL